MTRPSPLLLNLQAVERDGATELLRYKLAASVLREALDAVEEAFDPQLYDQLRKVDFDAHPDDEFSVNITAKLWRQIGRALSATTPSKLSPALSKVEE